MCAEVVVCGGLVRFGGAFVLPGAVRRPPSPAMAPGDVVPGIWGVGGGHASRCTAAAFDSPLYVI